MATQKSDGTVVYKIRQNNPNPDATDGKWKARFAKEHRTEAKKWAENKGTPFIKVRMPILLVLNGGLWGNDKLSKQMDRLGQKHKRYLRMGSYMRDQRQQHDLYLKYIRGTGNLAPIVILNIVGNIPGTSAKNIRHVLQITVVATHQMPHIIIAGSQEIIPI